MTSLVTALFVPQGLLCCSLTVILNVKPPLIGLMRLDILLHMQLSFHQQTCVLTSIFALVLQQEIRLHSGVLGGSDREGGGGVGPPHHQYLFTTADACLQSVLKLCVKHDNMCKRRRITLLFSMVVMDTWIEKDSRGNVTKDSVK